jgi:hypothetical protein
MTPNRQSPAYALLARHPSCHSRRMSSQGDPSAAARRADVLRLSDVQNHPVERLGLTRLRIKIKKQSERCPGGCGPQILSAFVKQRTYQPLPHRPTAAF